MKEWAHLPDPKTYNECMSRPDAELWKKSFNKEHEALTHVAVEGVLPLTGFLLAPCTAPLGRVLHQSLQQVVGGLMVVLYRAVIVGGHGLGGST